VFLDRSNFFGRCLAAGRPGEPGSFFTMIFGLSPFRDLCNDGFKLARSTRQTGSNSRGSRAWLTRWGETISASSPLHQPPLGCRSRTVVVLRTHYSALQLLAEEAVEQLLSSVRLEVSW
jgi:hypothetical protein